MALRKYREIAIEPPESALDAPFPVIDGMKAWKNEKNEFVVVACHYTADPEKRSDEWYTKATSGLRDDQVEREYEINFESKAGTKAFAFLENNEGVYRQDPPYPIPSHWKIICALDYGARNPTAINWYAVDEHRRFWSFDEFYKPIRELKGGYVALAEYLLKHPYYPRTKFITADPSIFNKSQNILVAKENNQKSYGTLMSIAELLEKEGIYKLQRANNDRIAGLARLNSMFNFRGEGQKTKPFLFIGKKCVKQWWELNNIMYRIDDSEIKNPEEDIVKRNDHCFAAGTLISTKRGQVPIEDIKKDDMILTRGGYQKVIGCGPTSVSNTIELYFSNGSTLVCTGNHPIFTKNRGFINANGLRSDDVLLSESEWKKETNNFLTGLGLFAIRTLHIIRGQLLATSQRKLQCIDMFGCSITGQFQMDSTSTIKTGTPRITTFQTWSAYLETITTRGTKKIERPGGEIQKGSPLSWRVQKRESIGIKQKLVSSIILGFRTIFGVSASPLIKNALSAAKTFWLHLIMRDSAETRVNRETLGQGKKQVYNLSVENHPEYFANGILVHNCYDATRYALMSENMPAEVIHDERAGFATLKAVEDEMEEDYAKKNQKDAFSCTFNELDGESEWDLRDYG